MAGSILSAEGTHFHIVEGVDFSFTIGTSEV